MKKTKIAIALAAAFVLSGCNDVEPEQKIIYKDPTPDQIQAAVNKHLATLNSESAELKQFVDQLKKTDPDVVGARYAFENGQRILKVAMEKSTGGITEYAIPIATGAFAGYTGAALADKLVALTFKGSNGKPDCDLDDLLEGDDDCRAISSTSAINNTGGSGTTVNNYNGGGSSFIFMSFPSYNYDTRDSYQSTSRKDTKIYNEQRVKQTARQRSEEIRNKNTIGSSNAKPKASYSNSYKQTDHKATAKQFNNTSKSSGEVKGALTQSRQVFSTQRNTARASGMTSGGRGWGG
ncbi:hypothetical protein OTK49_02380 [Vibrio coralliirubri]|uniref:hypothetical protein n=1 Tax=Vibrio coralliirubri TaxID=1516159 RepID=UPI002283C77C|nr:hypothetical protein [Vibrio coralliirubri]MCY9861363.1 hypothetical protein [Vibrio coralliirubri]